MTKGARRAFVDGPEYDVDTETMLVPYSLDPRWHELNHAAGLSGDDAGLDKFEPSTSTCSAANWLLCPRQRARSN
ncbi:hypothetical protein [Arthrobacter globiformis]|uniref:hypothetical protein n=1 Tax=Arthrobacter globiformis TaxID=1665 RepID=UPI0027946327|nr:hypothetical protein [Arthrobacter globiformis]MDQ0619635.1 hypothetical protein [Arthrobacter globiformis]